MSDHDQANDQAFEAIEAEGRIAAEARMLSEDEPLQPNQRRDIIERFRAFSAEHGYTQVAVAREIGVSAPALSDGLMRRAGHTASDKVLVRLHNWMELTARRRAVSGSRKFVVTSVAREILTVAKTVAETLKIGVVWGPAQIGKSMSLAAIEGDQAFGAPILVRVDESIRTPLPFCRALSRKLSLSPNGTFDRVFDRLCNRLVDTKRMIMCDEADRADFRTIETIRDLHDRTGCGVLFAGKPAIYEKLGGREMGDFSERFDQLGGRIVIRRDLTERTRTGSNPEPLYSLADIRALIAQAGLKLHVEPDAALWLQARAGSLGLGGIGRALVLVYLAGRVATAKGLETITVAVLEDCDRLTLGGEDATALRESAARQARMRRVV